MAANDVASGALPPQGGDVAPVSRVRLLGGAVLWCLAAMAGSAAGGFAFGVFAGATTLSLALPPLDLKVFYNQGGALGVEAVLLWGALRKARQLGYGNLRAGLGDGPLARPGLMVLLGIVTALYTSAVSLATYYAMPQMFAALLSLNTAVYLLMVFTTVATAPIIEELFFRGWLWVGLRREGGALAASFVSGLLFLAIHLPEGLPRVILLIPLAILLSLARHVSGSLRGSVALHAWNNILAIAVPWIALWLGWLARP